MVTTLRLAEKPNVLMTDKRNEESNCTFLWVSYNKLYRNSNVLGYETKYLYYNVELFSCDIIRVGQSLSTVK